jgi:hypothetical protein
MEEQNGSRSGRRSGDDLALLHRQGFNPLRVGKTGVESSPPLSGASLLRPRGFGRLNLSPAITVQILTYR